MTTVGEIFDKLIILEKRLSVVLEGDDPDKWCVVQSLTEQRKWLILSLGSTISDIAECKRPSALKKHKRYDKNVELDVEELYFIDLITKLVEFNHRLWDLEDKRRDLRLGDAERLKAADEVSKVNKLRNQTIDCIDALANVAGLEYELTSKVMRSSSK